MNEIPCYASIEVNGELYFSAMRINALFKMKLDSNEVTYLGRVKEEKREYGLHRFAFMYKNCIFFFPGCGDYVAKLQLDTLEISSIELPQKECWGYEYKFADIVCVKDSIWMIPSNYNAVLRFDLNEERIEKFDNWPMDLGRDNKEKRWFVAGCCVSHYICMCPYEIEYFIVFDMESRKMDALEWKYPMHAFSAMILHKDVLWFLPEREYPYIVGYSLETTEKYYIETAEKVNENIRYMHDGAAVVEDYIILTPFETNHWLVLDTRTKKVETLTVSKRGWSEKFQYPLYNSIQCVSDGLMVISLSHAYALFINLHSREVKEIRVAADNETSALVIKDALSQGGFYWRNQIQEAILNEGVWDLLDYLQALCMYSDQKGVSKADFSYGVDIFRKTI